MKDSKTELTVFSTKKIRAYDICLILFLAAALPFLLWKCRYGYGALDEPFYLTLAQRLSGGDALLSEEWNLSQLSGFLLLPFYRFHRLLFASTEGIVLHFRYFYVVTQLLTGCLLYCLLRRYRFGAVAAVSVFVLFTPYDIMALSYNTLGLMSMALCLAFLSCEKRPRLCSAAAGFFFAAAVLCNPYLISLYLLVLCGFVLIWIFTLISKNNNPKTHFSNEKVDFIFFTLGAAVLALLFLLFVMFRAGFSEIFSNLTHILNDPEHASRSFYAVVHSYCYTLFITFRSFLLPWLVVLLIALTDRNRYQNGWMYFCLTALLTAIAILTRIPYIQTDYNYIMFPGAACGLSAYLLTPHKDHRPFIRIWLPGMLYTFCLAWASNQGENAVCMGMPVVLIGSILLIREFLKQTPKQAGRYAGKLPLGIALLLLASQLSAQCYAKSVHAFWEPSVDELHVELTQGPLKGLRTTEEHANAYYTLLTDIAGYADNGETVLFLTSSPWCYLYADRPYGTYSSWISTLSSSADTNADELLLARLNEYYTLHPDRIPQDIYIAKNDLWEFSFLSDGSTCTPFSVTDASGASVGYSVSESANGYHLTRIFTK